MKRLITIVTILFVALSLFSWELDRQAQFPINIYGIDNYGTNVVIAGSDGAVGLSTDDGESFDFVASPTFDPGSGTYLDANDVSFADANHVAIGAENGMLLLSTDGGQSWTQASAVETFFGSDDIEGIIYLADGKIFASGANGKVVYSSDHGANWVLQTTPNSDTYYGISMNESGIGFIAANNGSPDLGKVIKTTDFGTNWEVLDLGVATNPTTFEVKQFGDRVVVLGDDGYVGVSNDNGLTWTNHPTAGGDSEPRMYGVTMNGDVGYATGWNGVVVKTTDGWQTTQILYNDWNYYAQDLTTTNSGDLMLAGWYGTVAKSTDGISWNEKTVSSVDNYSISLIDEDNWYLVGDKNTVFRTSDAGASYDKIFVATGTETLYDSKFFDENNGIVVGKAGVIYNTTDGGVSWTLHQVSGITSSKALYALEFINDQIGWAFGHEGFASKTTDGGANWTDITLTGFTSNDKIYTAFAFDENNILLGGKDGRVYRTNNGTDFTTINVSGGDVKDIYFTDADNGVLVNDDGEIYYTSNGGPTAGDWTAAVESADDDLNAIYETADGTLVVAGQSSDSSNLGTTWALMKSEDNGASWSEIDLPETTFNPVRLTAIAGWDNNVIVVGKNQLVYSGEIDNGGTTEPTLAVDLFFSEYIEGSGNNKALEIYNGTGEDVDLSQYVVKRGNNGNPMDNEEALTGTLADGGVFIIANPDADAAIQAVADITSTITYFNGDDTIGLFKDGQLIDVIGNEGEDPGVAWEVAGVTEATSEQTLVRKPTIGEGSSDWAISAGSSADNSQWIVYDQNDFSHIGSHEFTGGSADEYTSTPVIDPTSTTFDEAFEATITCSTEGASIYYTLDGSEPTDASTMYTTPISISETTPLKAIAYADGLEASFVATAMYTLLETVEVSTIADLRAGSLDGTTYSLTGEAVMTFSQTYRNQKFFQDATGGILVDDFIGIITSTYNEGDGVTGLTGTLTEYNGILEFIPTVDPGTATSNNNEVTAQVLTIDDLNNNLANHESELIKVMAVTFQETGSFTNGQNYNLSDGANTLVLRTQFFDVDYIGTEIPVSPVNITALCLQFNGTTQIIPRNLADFEPSGELEYGTISGQVTDAENNSPIEGATVTIGSLNAQTDASGNYSIADVMVNTYSVTCSATGYATAITADVQVNVDANTEVNFALDQATVPDNAIVINEIMYNSASWDNEWVEFYNISDVEVSLAGWTFTDNDAEHTPYTFGAEVVIPANGYLTLAIDHHEEAEPFPFTPDVDATEVLDWNLGNTSEDLSILDASGNVVDQVIYQDSGDWPSAADGTGATLELIDPMLDNSLASSWQASTIMGGTPGQANSGAAQVIEVADLAELRNQTVGGDEYIITGEVILTYQQDYRGQKYLQDANAGILIDDNNGVITSTYMVGDGITGLRGTLSEYGNMLQLIPTEDPGSASSSNNAITALEVSLEDLTNNFDTYESRVVKVNDVTFNSAGNFENGSIYELSDGTDTFNFRATFYDVDYIGLEIPSEILNITAIANSRTDGNYISARNSADLEISEYPAPSDLQANITPSGSVELLWTVFVLPMTNKSYVDETGNEVVVNGNSRNTIDREPTSHKVYRDDVMIAEVDGYSYYDQDLEDGTYTYYVTAMYDQVESVPSNSVTVTIGGDDALLTDDFEAYDDFAIDFANWTLVDNDLSQTYGIENTEFDNAGLPMAYMVFNPASTTPAITEAGFMASSGSKYLASFASMTPDNDDWLISRAFTIDAEASLSFMAKSITDSYGLERFNVLVSNGSTDLNDFTVISGDTYVEAPLSWNSYTYDLNAYAGQTVRFAIQCVSSDAFIFMIDDIEVLAPNGTPISSDDVELAGNALLNNYPNPFNPETTIAFNVKDAGDVTIDIYNIKGQKVKQLVNDNYSTGIHTVVWNGQDDNNNKVSSGVYFYKMRSGKYSKTKKMILMK